MADTCRRGHPRTDENSYANARGQRICRVCNRENHNAKNAALRAAGGPEYEKWLADHRRRSNTRAAADRRVALAHYGAACACCGESEEVFLAIDHVDGRAAYGHPRSLSSTRFYRWLRRQGYPPGFQTLCHNCNYAKHAYGRCPHQPEVMPNAPAA